MITILTITARGNPMFGYMANSISEAAKRCPVPIEWLVVDAILWYRDGHRRGQLQQAVRDRFPVHHIPPKPSKWHGPWKDQKLGEKELPDTNGARNTGLVNTRGDYLILFDDCSRMTPGLLALASQYRDKGDAVAFWYEKRGSIDGDLVVRGDPPQETNPTSGFKGSGVGFPVEWLLRANGWDEAFGGQRSGNDLEIAIRMHRLGLKCWCDFTEGVFEQNHPLLHHNTAHMTTRNDEIIGSLISSNRTWPTGNPFDIRELRKKTINE